MFDLPSMSMNHQYLIKQDAQRVHWFVYCVLWCCQRNQTNSRTTQQQKQTSTTVSAFLTSLLCLFSRVVCIQWKQTNKKQQTRKPKKQNNIKLGDIPNSMRHSFRLSRNPHLRTLRGTLLNRTGYTTSLEHEPPEFEMAA